MSKGLAILVIVILILIIIVGLFLGLTPTGHRLWNSWTHNLQVADDQTDYDTLKQVEDTCRAMISTYESDRLTWEQYKNSDNEEEQSWASQAQMRANRTAATYNNYILENSYIWKDNVPADIYMELEYLS